MATNLNGVRNIDVPFCSMANLTPLSVSLTRLAIDIDQFAHSIGNNTTLRSV